MKTAIIYHYFEVNRTYKENFVFFLNTAIFDDKNKQVTIQDENKNCIVMSSSGITIKSAKNISIEASQKLTTTWR